MAHAAVDAAKRAILDHWPLEHRIHEAAEWPQDETLAAVCLVSLET
jgi:hypothetical protein